MRGVRDDNSYQEGFQVVTVKYKGFLGPITRHFASMERAVQWTRQVGHERDATFAEREDIDENVLLVDTARLALATAIQEGKEWPIAVEDALESAGFPVDDEFNYEDGLANGTAVAALADGRVIRLVFTIEKDGKVLHQEGP